MESTRPVSRAGEPLGSERLGALVPLPGEDSGPAFAREVERAAARARGDGLAARRHETLADERRAQRRAGFEGEHAQAEAPRAAPAPAPTPAPVERADVARSAAPATPTGAPAPDAPPSGCASCTPATPAESTVEVSAAPRGASAAPSGAPAGAGPARAALGAAPLSETRAAAPAPEVPALLAKPASSAARAPGATAPAEGPEAAPLARAEAILEQIRLHATPGVRRLTLELEPADLGRLSIQLALRSGRVTAIVRAEDARTLELLEQRSDELQALLDARGLCTDSLTFALGFASPRARRGSGPPAPPTSDPVRASGPGLDTLA